MILSVFSSNEANEGSGFLPYRLKACIIYARENMAHQAGRMHVQSLKRNSWEHLACHCVFVPALENTLRHCNLYVELYRDQMRTVHVSVTGDEGKTFRQKSLS